MGLQSSGSISLSDIAGEFGGSKPHSMSEYYGVAPGVPSSGGISMSNFYGASAESWSISATSYSINEGASVTFTVTTTGVANGTVFNVQIIAESGFDVSNDLTTDTPSGQLTISNGRASVTYYMTEDLTTESTEQFRVGAYYPGANDWLVISDYVNVYDTSRDPISFSTESVILGGGGGGARFNGGGGAGAFLYIPSSTLWTGYWYPITIGAGGARSPGMGNQGNNTSAFGLTARGGGGGGQRGHNTSPYYASGAGGPSTDQSGVLGGSGGGASAYDSPPGAPGGTGGSYGRPGGPAYNGTGWGGSGGGGAGGSGYPHQRSTGGNGGSGATIPANLGGGSVCGGGGGGNYSDQPTGTAGSGAGPGWSARSPAPSAIDGDPGSGAGGGGCSEHGPGSAGGSGVVRLTHPTSIDVRNPDGGLAMSKATTGGRTLTTIHSGSGNVQFIEK